MIPLVSVKMVPLINLLKPPLISVPPPTLISGVRPMVTKPLPLTSSLSSAPPPPPSFPSLVKTCPTSRTPPSSVPPKVVTSLPMWKMRTLLSSRREVKSASRWRLLRNLRLRVSRSELSVCPAGPSSMPSPWNTDSAS